MEFGVTEVHGLAPFDLDLLVVLQRLICALSCGRSRAQAVLGEAGQQPWGAPWEALSPQPAVEPEAPPSEVRALSPSEAQPSVLPQPSAARPQQVAPAEEGAGRPASEEAR